MQNRTAPGRCGSLETPETPRRFQKHPTRLAPSVASGLAMANARHPQYGCVGNKTSLDRKRRRNKNQNQVGSFIIRTSKTLGTKRRQATAECCPSPVRSFRSLPISPLPLAPLPIFGSPRVPRGPIAAAPRLRNQPGPQSIVASESPSLQMAFTGTTLDKTLASTCQTRGLQPCLMRLQRARKGEEQTPPALDICIFKIEKHNKTYRFRACHSLDMPGCSRPSVQKPEHNSLRCRTVRPPPWLDPPNWGHPYAVARGIRAGSAFRIKSFLAQLIHSSDHHQQTTGPVSPPPRRECPSFFLRARLPDLQSFPETAHATPLKTSGACPRVKRAGSQVASCLSSHSTTFHCPPPSQGFG